VNAIIENALDLFISWTVQIMIFGSKLLHILSGTANVLPSMEALAPATTAHAISKTKVAPTHSAKF
jgi:hypothetical protein